MKTFKEIIGAEPIYHEEDNSYTPSKASLAIGAPKKSDYDHRVYENAYTGGDKKVLVLCVDEKYLECTNGKRMRTGNHPIELFVVLMHLQKAGFKPEFATLTGGAVVIEEFAMPTEDEAVVAFRQEHSDDLQNPKVLSEVVNNLNDDYVAVYIPGGHGAILGLPESNDTKNALKWFIDNDKPIVTICHGPSSLLSLTKDEDPADFYFQGYKLACFPDSGDSLMTQAGYLPGKMPWGFSTILEGLNVEIVSKTPIGKTQVDRNLISGDTPMAANKLGNIAADFLLNKINA